MRPTAGGTSASHMMVHGWHICHPCQHCYLVKERSMSASHLDIPKEPIMLARLPTRWSILAFVQILAAGTIRLDDKGKGSARWMMMRARKCMADDDEGEEAHGGRWDMLRCDETAW